MDLEITTEFIKLNQALKLANFISNGSDTKYYVDNNKVLLNGSLVNQYRKKLYDKDKVEVLGIGEINIKCI